MNLPIFQTALQELSLMQTRWASLINKYLSNPSLQSNILPNLKLVTGTTIINHLLGRKLVGWRVIRVNAMTHFCDHQDTNQTPEFTLALETTDDVICTLEVF